MKKVAVAIAALGVMATASFGDIFVNWRADVGFYENGSGGNDYPADGILFPSGSVLVQLLWTPDAGTTAVDAFLPNYLANGGNDIVLAARTVGFGVAADISAADEFANFTGTPNVFLNANYGPTTLQGGYVYARVFSDTTPGLGDYYFQSSNSVALTAYTGSEQANVLDINTDHTNGNELNQVVPEPSVLAFLGAGALVVAYRRMRRNA